MQEDRDDLLLSGINLHKRFNSLDRNAVVQYDIYDIETHDKVVKPWMKLIEDCIVWQSDLKKFMNENKIDKVIWCDLLLFDSLTFGIGVGGAYTTKILNQMECQIKQGIVILKKIKLITAQNSPVPLEKIRTIKGSRSTYQFNSEKKSGILTIIDHSPIDFFGRRAVLLEIFNMASASKDWINYDRIKRELVNEFIVNSAQIRKDIRDINKRCTKDGINDVISSREKPGDARGTQEYRWGC